MEDEPLIADTGSTGTYVSVRCRVLNKRPTSNPISISNPNGQIMTSTHEGELDLPTLRFEARRAHIVPALQHCSLLSVGSLCDAGYTVEFNKQTMRVLDDDGCVLTGTRHTPTGMWHVPADPSNDSISHAPHAQANKLGGTTIAESVTYAHASLYSPALSTLEFALDNNFLTNFPGLTVDTLRRHAPKSIPMDKGHMDQIRQNVRSTKPPRPKPEPDTDTNPSPITIKTHDCYVAIYEPQGQIYSDQTGRFVVSSSSGNNYIMVLYDYDSNHIFVQPFQNRTAKCILDAYKILHAHLTQAGLKPRLQRLDNECSKILKQFMHEQDVDFQLVPPGMHRRNAAERSIRTFQNHFIAGLCSVDKNFPLHLWDKLLPQAEITLNLLRASRINPNVSAYAQINGTFDFNRTPLGPPGCRVLAHDKPDKRTTWAPHGLDGWYVGPALDSYRCWQIWIWESRAVRICDTVTWYPTKVKLPDSSSTATIIACLKDIADALKNPSPQTPLAPLTDTHNKALRDITELLTNVTPPPPPVTKVPNVPALPKPTPSVLRVPTPVPDTTPEHPATPLRVLVPNSKVTFTNDTKPPKASDAPAFTYAEVTGIAGKRHRKQQRQPVSANGTHISGQQRRKLHRKKTKQFPTPATLRKTLQKTIQLAKPKPLRRQPASKVIDVETALPGAPATIQPVNHQSGKRRQRIRRQARLSQPAERRSPRIHKASYANYAAAKFYQYLAMHGTAMHPETGMVAEYKALSKSSDGLEWKASNTEEIGRMFQGLGPNSTMPTGTNTCFFIPKDEIPKHKKPTYIRVVCANRPEKPNPKRVRWTAGGDRIEYHGNVTCPTADLTTAKLMFNSVLSTPGAKFMGINLKDFYLCSQLDDYEYVRIPEHMLPAEIVELYDLKDKIVNGFVYAEVRKGMYGLPQAGRLANLQLQNFLEPHGYVPCPITPGLWKDLHSDLQLTLVVDNFGVRYTKKSDVDRLLTTLQKEYKCSTDWTGNRYIGLTLDWNYEKGTVTLSMPGYIERALTRFEHPPPSRPEYLPHAWNAPTYGSRQQYVTHVTSELLDAKDTKRVQEVLGTLLYYARAIDCTLVPSIGSIATDQSCATKLTMVAITKLLNHVATYPDASITYHASGMQLYVESDASYLSETKARSRFAGFHYLSDKLDDPAKPPTNQPPLNGAINVPCKILKEVLSSASEAEMAGLYHNGKEAVPERITLEELGHPQPATPIVTDNSTASGIANDSVKQKRSKAMDMRFYWVRNRVRQGQFIVYWRRGISNRADYFTKHHSDKHHRVTRPIYIQDKTKPHSHNSHSVLSEDPPTTAGTPSPISGEGVLIPSAACARQPFYALRYPPRRPSVPARCASFSANRRH